MKPLVSIIIANWNGGKVFEDCLISLARITYPNWELIVVDNASSDGSDRLVKKIIKRARLIKNNSNVGFAKANNQAIENVNGKYILLLNNDTKVEKDFLSKMVGRMEEDVDVGVIQPKIFMMDKPGYLDNAGSFFTKIGFLEHWGFGKKDGREFEKEKEIFSAKGACMLIRASVIKEIGLFDPDFVSYFEESDFCWRVWLSGFKVIFYPKTKIYHKVGFTIRRLDVANINFHYYKNRICSLIKNLGLINLFIILPIHIFISLGIVGVFLIRGNSKNSLIILNAIVWNITNLRDTLKKREKIQRRRKVDDSSLFKHLSRPVDFSKFFGDFKRVEKDLKFS